MKVIADGTQDRFGNAPLWFKGASIKEIHDYLYRNYQGYKFAILFDETGEEYEPFDNPVPVYFLDEIMEEAASYCGVKIAKENNDGHHSS